MLLVPAELSHRSLIFAPRGGFAAVSFFIFFLSLEPPDAVFALHDFRVQIRWRKLAIPSLRSLRGFESLTGSPPKVFSVGLFQAPESTLLKVLFSCPVWGHDPRRFARFRRSRNDTADTALDAIGTPCNDRYSVTSFLPKVQPETKGALPVAKYPFQISETPQYLVLFLPSNFSGCQPFFRFDSQIQPIPISHRFSALFPAFRTACFCPALARFL